MLKKKTIRYYSTELKPFYCPKCGCRMIWCNNQGSFGGWKCPNDGLEIEYKGGM